MCVYHLPSRESYTKIVQSGSMSLKMPLPCIYDVNLQVLIRNFERVANETAHGIICMPGSSGDQSCSNADKHKFGPAATKMSLKKPPASFDDMPVAGPPSPLKTACQNVVELCTVTTCAQLQAPAADPQLAINHDNKDGNTTSSTKSTRASSTSTQVKYCTTNIIPV